MAKERPAHDRRLSRVELTRQIADWLQKNDVSTPEMAVDFADLLIAAHSVERSLSQLVTLDANNPEHADVALELAGDMAARLFTEMRGHLDSLEKDWEQFEDRLEELGRVE